VNSLCITRLGNRVVNMCWCIHIKSAYCGDDANSNFCRAFEVQNSNVSTYLNNIVSKDRCFKTLFKFWYFTNSNCLSISVVFKKKLIKSIETRNIRNNIIIFRYSSCVCFEKYETKQQEWKNNEPSEKSLKWRKKSEKCLETAL